MASVRLKDICKVYPNGLEAVKNFNMEIEDKEFIVFVGPSGCGKSTALRTRSHNIRRTLYRRQACKRSRTEGQRYCDGVSELCSVSAYDYL